MQKEDVRGEDEGTGAPHEVEEAGPHRQRSPEGYRPQGHKELDTIEVT